MSTGLGPTRRIVLYDNLLASPPELVEQVVAHELGHVRRRHLVRQAAGRGGRRAGGPGRARLDRRAAVAVRGVRPRRAPATPPAWRWPCCARRLVTAPAALPLSWLSRGFEREADAEALDLLGRPDLVEAMLRRLQHTTWSTPLPGASNGWRPGHPPVAERIAFARAWPRAVTGAREVNGKFRSPFTSGSPAAPGRATCGP